MVLPLLSLLLLLPAPGVDPALWPESERAFLQDGPGFLLTSEERGALLAMGPKERSAWIEAFLDQDPDPNTPDNELRIGIERRRELALSEIDTPADARARLLFLHGTPLRRDTVECVNAFLPLEIWSYGKDDDDSLVLFEERPGEPWRIWNQRFDPKATLYNPEMRYWMAQWEELEGKLFYAERFDVQACRIEAREVDKATGVRDLSRRVRAIERGVDVSELLAPPADLAAWALAAAAEPSVAPPRLPIRGAELSFPGWKGQRIQTRLLLALPREGGPIVDEAGESPELRLVADVVVERAGQPFDRFTARFVLPPPPASSPAIPIALQRPLRPGEAFVLRVRLRDEVGEAEGHWTGAVQVPEAPDPTPTTPVSDEVLAEVEEGLALQRIEGADFIRLVPPETEVVTGLWTAEALVAGSRIARVAFLVDGEEVLTRNRPPWRAKLRLPILPRELVVRAEGRGESGELVVVDELVLNQPRGVLAVRIVDPPRGVPVRGSTRVRAEITVPEDRKVDRVEFLFDGELLATDQQPPWEARVEIDPAPEGVSFLTVAAILDDGTRTEDVRLLGAVPFSEELQVRLVELFVAVTNRAGEPVEGLAPDDFEILEDGRRQQLRELQLVRDLPLTVGIALDTSSSMDASVGEAKDAAIRFLETVVRPGDRAFALTFDDRPVLLVPPTGDVAAVTTLLARQEAHGWTALHDAVVTCLFHFRGTRGQRALILISDGDDSTSETGFAETLEYARRSGVSIYPLGLGVGGLDLGIRHKLQELAKTTGGKAFFLSEVDELEAAYREIEAELRTRYLLTYAPEGGDPKDGFREVEVEVRRRGLKARTTRGYSP